MTTTQLSTISQFVEKHPFATHGGLRHLIFHSQANGFGRVIKRMGRRILIDEKEFFTWLEDNNKIKEVINVK